MGILRLVLASMVMQGTIGINDADDIFGKLSKLEMPNDIMGIVEQISACIMDCCPKPSLRMMQTADGSFCRFCINCHRIHDRLYRLPNNMIKTFDE